MGHFSVLTWSVVPVEDGESEEGSVAVGSEGGLGQWRQVVHVVETRAVCVIVARQQQVHMIWSLDTEEREREWINIQLYQKKVFFTKCYTKADTKLLWEKCLGKNQKSSDRLTLNKQAHVGIMQCRQKTYR